MGGREGPGGIVTAPQLSQEIVTGGKLRLGVAAAVREVDQAALSLAAERLSLLTAVRQGFFEVLTAQRRVEILGELAQLATQSVDLTQRLFESNLVARIDLLQVRIELNRFRAEQEAARRELDAAFRRLAATMGTPDLPATPLSGSLEASLPEYELEEAHRFVREAHPQVQAAMAGVARAQLLLQRARVEPIPNVTVAAGYTRNNKERDDQWTFQVSVPLPVFDRNQGNIAAARASLGQANQQVAQVGNELVAQLAAAFGGYGAAKERIERYRATILPDARESFRLSLEAYRGGQFEYLRVLQAQRSVAEANLEYNRALGEAWRSASEIAGLLLQEAWPAPARGNCTPDAAAQPNVPWRPAVPN